MGDYTTTVREDIEWIGIRWHDEAATKGLKRILLIGDSIVAGHGTMLRDKLKGKFGVDYFATSKIVSDHEYMPDLDFMMSRYHYDMIIFNNLLHGGKVDDLTYVKALEEVIDILRTRTEYLVWRNGTPCFQLDESKPENSWIHRCPKRNTVAAVLMGRKGIPVIDAFNALKNCKAMSADGVHFKPEGYQILVDLEAEAIEKHFAQ